MTPLFSKAVFYLYETLQGRDTMNQYRHFLETQWYTKERLQVYQFYKLKSLLEHAYKNVAYYAELFDKHGFNPYIMNSLSDFKKLPFLTKKIIRDNGIDRFIARGTDKNKLLKVKTGGSTGDPLVLYLCDKRRTADMAAKLRMVSWQGIDIGDKRIRLRGIPAGLSFKGRVNTFLIYLMNIRVLNAFDMSEKNMERYVEVIKRYKPKILTGYANAIYLLAKFIEKKGVASGYSSLKSIFAGAEGLSDRQKDIIANIFNCSVISDYGSMEGGSIATECPQGNLHIASDNVFLELVREEKEVFFEEEGEVVVTNFYNYAMPLIRYKQDDIAVLSGAGCPCQREFPVIKRLKGRKLDFIISPDGRMIHGVAFKDIISEARGVECFRLVQKEAGRITITLEKNEHFSPEAADEIKKKIDNLCEKKLEVDFILTDKIESSHEGTKYKYIVSEIAGNYF